MANTYTLIASYEATGSVANIEFTTIPATYTDLLVKVSIRGTSNIGVAGLILEYNSSSSNLKYIRILGDGSAASSATATIGQVSVVQGGNATANTFSNQEIYIPNYTSANYKSASGDSVNETNATEEYMSLNAHLWSDTAAITSLKLTPNAGSLVQYSTAYLYGIKNS
jgi:hypothetical protein